MRTKSATESCGSYLIICSDVFIGRRCRLQEPAFHNILLAGSSPIDFQAVAAECKHLRFRWSRLEGWCVCVSCPGLEFIVDLRIDRAFVRCVFRQFLRKSADSGAREFRKRLTSRRSHNHYMMQFISDVQGVV